jgi:AcrR family transcriptional regulator
MSLERKHREVGTLREQRKAETRDLILDAALEMMAANAFDRETHDELARRVGVARRTVYRYFPTRDSLIEAAWRRVNINPSGVTYSLPTDAGSVTRTIDDFFDTVEANGLAVLVAMTTPPGRAARASGREPRGVAWRAALAAEVINLPEEERDLPLAVMQLMRSGFAWVEMRDQWGLSAAQMTTAVRWATRTLLKDLKARDGRSLDTD